MAPRPTKKSPGSTTPQPPPRPDLPVQARHPPPPGLPATAPRPTAVVGRVAELMGGKPQPDRGLAPDAARPQYYSVCVPVGGHENGENRPFLPTEPVRTEGAGPACRPGVPDLAAAVAGVAG